MTWFDHITFYEHVFSPFKLCYSFMICPAVSESILCQLIQAAQ